MKVRIILKSGADFTVTCKNFTCTQTSFGGAVAHEISGITENPPIYLDPQEIAAVIRVSSDE